MDAPLWAGLVDGGSTAPSPSRFYRPRTEDRPGATSIRDHQTDAQPSNQASLLPRGLAVSELLGSDIKPSLPSVQSSTIHEAPLIPTQPETIQGESQHLVGATPTMTGTPLVRPYVNLIVLEPKYPDSAPHDYLILSTDDENACRGKASRLDDLLSTGHTLSAQLGLLNDAPTRYTPDMLAMEGMKPAERQAWTWWAKCEASAAGSGSRQLPALDIERHRAPVPTVAVGNKSSVAEKTPALELVYGLPTGTLSAEHVSYFLRPENANHFPILTAALRILKARQHCASSAGIGALFVDPRYKIEIEALKDFQQQLRTRHTSLLVKGDIMGLPWIEEVHARVQLRIDWLEQASQPLRQKDIVKKQASQLRKPVWEP